MTYYGGYFEGKSCRGKINVEPCVSREIDKNIISIGQQFDPPWEKAHFENARAKGWSIAAAFAGGNVLGVMVYKKKRKDSAVHVRKMAIVPPKPDPTLPKGLQKILMDQDQERAEFAREALILHLESLIAPSPVGVRQPCDTLVIHVPEQDDDLMKCLQDWGFSWDNTIKGEGLKGDTYVMRFDDFSYSPSNPSVRERLSALAPAKLKELTGVKWEVVERDWRSGGYVKAEIPSKIHDSDDFYLKTSEQMREPGKGYKALRAFCSVEREPDPRFLEAEGTAHVHIPANWMTRPAYLKKGQPGQLSEVFEAAETQAEHKPSGEKPWASKFRGGRGGKEMGGPS